MAFESVQIVTTRNGVSPVTGYREDLAIADVVSAALTSYVGVTSVRWELAGRPTFSAAGGAGPEPIVLATAPSSSFTVDNDSGGVRRDGTYVLHAFINPGAPNETRKTVILARVSGITIAAPGATVRNLRKLGGFEEMEDTNDALVAQGWSKQENWWKEVVRQIFFGGSGTTTLADAYAHGAGASDQTPVLLDVKGGGVVLDATQGGFTGQSALRINTPAGGPFVIDRATGRLGLGTATPSLSLHAVGSSPGLRLDRTGGAALDVQNVADELRVLNGATVLARVMPTGGVRSDFGLAVGTAPATNPVLSLGAASTVPVSAAGEGRIRYNESIAKLQYSVNTGAWTTFAAAASAYDTIQVGGTPLTQRTTLNFTGGLTAVDNPGSTRTDVTTSLTATQVGFGGVSNTLTGSSSFTYDSANERATLNRTFAGFGAPLILNNTLTSANTGISLGFNQGGSRIATLSTGGFNSSGPADTIALFNGANTQKPLVIALTDRDTWVATSLSGSIPLSTTTGFLWQPNLAGVPSGTPAYTSVALNNRATVLDETDFRFYAYLGGAWHYAAFNDGIAAATTLTSGQVGYGSVSNTMTSSAALKFDASAFTVLTIGDGGSSISTSAARLRLDGPGGVQLTNSIDMRSAGTVFLSVTGFRDPTASTGRVISQNVITPVSGGSSDDRFTWGSNVGQGTTEAVVYVENAHNDVALGGVAGGNAIATNGTYGFVYLPQTAGAPTGVPSRDGNAVILNRQATVIDTSHKRWYYYDTGTAAWHYAEFNDGVASSTTLAAGQVGFGSPSNLLTGNGQLTFDTTTFGSAVPQLLVGDGATTTNGHIILANTGTLSSRIRFANGGTAVGNVFAEVNVSKDAAAGTGRVVYQHNLVPVAGGSGNDYWSVHQNSTVNNPLHVYVSKYDVAVGSPVSLATGATNGFLYLPRVAGAPTGVPDRLGIAGETLDRYPVVIDSTNKRWYYYDGAGAAWHYVKFDDGGSAITALTGDVTATGPGSATATFRNGSATSVLGRSANSSGAIADIAASADGNVLWRNGTSLQFSALPYSKLSGTPTIFYQTVAAAGSSLTQRSILNFSALLPATDNAGAGRTDVTLADTAVTPGSYTLASITVDAQGRLTAASSGSPSGSFVPLSRTVTGTAPLQIAGDNAAHDLSADRVWSLAFDGTSLTLNAGSLQRAALSGDITAAAGNNSTSFRNGGALSVLGRSANSTGAIADIAAASNGDVLRVASGVLGFGTIPAASVTNLFYQSVDGAGVGVTQRPTLNFNAAFSVVDNSGASRTDVSLVVPLANRVAFSDGTSLVGNAAFQWDNSAARVLFMGAPATQKWANVGTLGVANTEYVEAGWASNVFSLEAKQTGGLTVRGMRIASTAGVTVDEVLLVNGPTAPSNVSFIVGHATNSNRDHVQFFLGGGSSIDTAANTFFDVFVHDTAITAANNSGVLASMRVRNLTYTGTGSPTPTEATSLYIDGAPTLSGASGAAHAIHVASGSTLLDGDLTTNSTDVRLNAASNLIGISPNIGFSSGFGSAPALSLSSSAAFFNLDGTIASSAGARWEALVIDHQGAVTVSGSIPITTAVGFNQVRFTTPQLATAATIDLSATVKIEGGPAIQSGGGSITNSYSLWNVGLARFDGNGSRVFELPADPTGNTTNATGRVPIKVGGVTKYLRYFDS